jgi:hypothetical protein
MLDDYDEKITAPYLLLKTKNGDCDDFALFSKTCLDILRAYQKSDWISSYWLLGKNYNEFTHIVCYAHRGRFLFSDRDPVIIDGANKVFNTINNKYRYKKELL